MSIIHHGVYEIKVWDSTSDDASHFIYIPVMDEGNITAQTDLNESYRDALPLISLGNVVATRTVADDAHENGAEPASDPTSQAELVWQMIYRDTVTLDLDTFSVACPNLDTSLRKLYSDVADLTVDAWVEFKAAFEAASVSRNGNPVELVGATLKAR